VLANDLRIFGAPVLVSMIGVIIVAIGLVHGALVVGGADSYGYVSQGDAWARGTYRFDEPLIREFAGRISRDALVPLGYQAVGEQGTVVPVYSPGLPMVMGVAQRIGGRGAVFLIVPLLAGVAILASYVMGLRVAGQTAGVAAAVLLATSPSFLFQLMAAPMSDVPVTAWWALALALLLFDSRVAAWLAGCAASLAILTRPNLALLASYLFYQAFREWSYVRFMLPAFPPLLVLTSITVVAASSRLRYWPRTVVPVSLVAVVAWYGLDRARDHGAFAAHGERKYAVAGGYVARRLPAKAAVLSMQHSGSIRYYSGRATVRTDLIPPSQLDSTLAALRDSGYRPYILLEPWEVAPFQQRYAGHSALAPLDWPPAALLRESGIRIYDPADRQALAGRPPLTEIVP
jgi:hypothetical protein